MSDEYEQREANDDLLFLFSDRSEIDANQGDDSETQSLGPEITWNQCYSYILPRHVFVYIWLNHSVTKRI